MGLAGCFRFRLGTLLVVAGLVLPGVNAFAQTVESSYANQSRQVVGYRAPAFSAGVQAYRDKQYEQASHYFREALGADPFNSNTHYYLALTLEQLGHTAEAAVEYHFVTQYGREPNVVSYALERLTVLSPPVPGNGDADSFISVNARGGDIAMMAAGMPTVPAVMHRMTPPSIAVPLKSNQNALMVDAMLGQDGQWADGTFIIDTGATYTSISREMAETLALDLDHAEKVSITTANGRIDVPKLRIQTLSVNGLEAHDVEVTVIPVRQGSSFSGLLGLSFIKQFVVTIDPQAGNLIFRKN